LADACGAFSILSALEYAPLALASIESSYTAEELAEIKHNEAREKTSGRENDVRKGYLGEFGLRKHLSKHLRIKQNFTHTSGVYHFDWTGDLGVVDVKGQRWLSKDVVLKGSGPEHIANDDLLLTFTLVGERGRLPLEPHEGERLNYLVPLALIDTTAFKVCGRELDSKQPGKAVSVTEAYKLGLLYPLNTAWWKVVYAPG